MSDVPISKLSCSRPIILDQVHSRAAYRANLANRSRVMTSRTARGFRLGKLRHSQSARNRSLPELPDTWEPKVAFTAFVNTMVANVRGVCRNRRQSRNYSLERELAINCHIPHLRSNDSRFALLGRGMSRCPVALGLSPFLSPRLNTGK